jgi:hypothetical protein
MTSEVAMTRKRRTALARAAEDRGVIVAVALFGLLPLSLATGLILTEMVAALLRVQF